MIEKIGALPRLEHFGPEAEQLGNTYLEARIEREDAETEQRRLQTDGGKTAAAADIALADEAFKAGKAKMPGTPNAAKYTDDVARAAARLRVAKIAEQEAGEDLYRALVAARDQAAISADAALDQAADDHSKAIAAVMATRGRLLAAEVTRRYVDGVEHAAEYDAGNPSRRHESSRPEFVWPVKPATRPTVRRVGDRLIHLGTGHVDDIENGLAALRQEIDLVFLRPDTGHANASEDTPEGEQRQFKAAGDA
jgi:hypothetical protein